MRVTKEQTMFTFHQETNDTVKEIITMLANEYPRRRVRVWYGDVKTGRSWNDEHDIMGYIGRSTGDKKIPLLVNNSKSYGGGALLDHCIIRIDDIKAKKTLYKHDNFHTDLFEEPSYSEDFTMFEVKRATLSGVEVFARFKTYDKAVKYLKFMEGERYSK